MKSVQIIIGGSQGSGIETSSLIMSAALARGGYGVFSSREYYSNIVGRHSYIHLRASADGLPMALSYPVDAVAALDAESVFFHFDDVKKDGLVVYDADSAKTRLRQISSMEPETRARIEERIKSIGAGDSVEALLEAVGAKAVSLSYSALLKELAEAHGVSRAEAQRYRSSIVVGALSAFMGIEELVYSAIERRFSKRPAAAKINKWLVSRVAEHVRSTYGQPLKLDGARSSIDEVLLVSGNDIVAMGKIVGGLGYQSYYPITPATDESVLEENYESLRAGERPLGSIVVMQTEDEIAAIASAIGASLAGARASTSTSGPGFSLMVEALGWAGMNETPVVITYYQRGGPSTGLPTRGSQSDLLFALFAGHGEFPRAVIASGDHLEAFYDAIWAFNIAEKYQIPVIHLIDKFLANAIATVPLPDWSKIEIDRGLTVREASGPVKRFRKDHPISPRPLLGSGAITWYTGDEHNEMGHITEDPVNRLEMYEKRQKKLELMDSEIPEERRAIYYGNGGEDFLLVGWGSTKGAALEALRALREEGLNGAFLQIRMFQPFPSRLVKKILSSFDPERVIGVEANIEAQALKVIAMNTGIIVEKRALKWTGRPIYVMELVDAVKRLLGGERRVVMSYGK